IQRLVNGTGNTHLDFEIQTRISACASEAAGAPSSPTLFVGEGGGLSAAADALHTCRWSLAHYSSLRRVNWNATTSLVTLAGYAPAAISVPPGANTFSFQPLIAAFCTKT